MAGRALSWFCWMVGMFVQAFVQALYCRKPPHFDIHWEEIQWGVVGSSAMRCLAAVLGFVSACLDHAVLAFVALGVFCLGNALQLMAVTFLSRNSEKASTSGAPSPSATCRTGGHAPWPSAPAPPPPACGGRTPSGISSLLTSSYGASLPLLVLEQQQGSRQVLQDRAAPGRGAREDQRDAVGQHVRGQDCHGGRDEAGEEGERLEPSG
eukprot:CAMPEP_0175625050 /NCGR_PEP_ID=MMETSP0096-20121207/70271_1 /TAXON_ID=311494 /ORGANISM="Alexandrium monilatum, Strain CCMP3105" /LENGTH=208 /DNA_ID=CAMNT_0016930379 /DNA_START=16 /DNA_END=639 /DNA_ORIENTATION=-